MFPHLSREHPAGVHRTKRLQAVRKRGRLRDRETRGYRPKTSKVTLLHMEPQRRCAALLPNTTVDPLQYLLCRHGNDAHERATANGNHSQHPPSHAFCEPSQERSWRNVRYHRYSVFFWRLNALEYIRWGAINRPSMKPVSVAQHTEHPWFFLSISPAMFPDVLCDVLDSDMACAACPCDGIYRERKPAEMVSTVQGKRAGGSGSRA